MPFYDIEYRRPVVQAAIPQDKVMETPWRLIKRFHSYHAPEAAMKEFKELQVDFMGHDLEIKSIRESAELTPLEEFGAML